MAETVNSGSVEPDQANTCEGNKSRYLTRILLEIYLQITTVFSYCDPSCSILSVKHFYPYK